MRSHLQKYYAYTFNVLMTSMSKWIFFILLPHETILERWRGDQLSHSHNDGNELQSLGVGELRTFQIVHPLVDMWNENATSLYQQLLLSTCKKTCQNDFASRSNKKFITPYLFPFFLYLIRLNETIKHNIHTWFLAKSGTVLCKVRHPYTALHF